VEEWIDHLAIIKDVKDSNPSVGVQVKDMITDGGINHHLGNSCLGMNAINVDTPDAKARSEGFGCHGSRGCLLVIIPDDFDAEAQVKIEGGSCVTKTCWSSLSMKTDMSHHWIQLCIQPPDNFYDLEGQSDIWPVTPLSWARQVARKESLSDSNPIRAEA